VSPASLKKQHERFVLEQFFRAAKLQGDIVDDISEAPDFIVRFDQELIGIEMTELFLTDGTDASNLQAQEALAQRIVSNAQRLYASSGAQHAHVSVHFGPRADLRILNRDEVAAALCALVKAQALEVSQRVHWRQDYRGDVLPEAITYVQMLGVPEARMAHWSVPKAGWVAPMTEAVLQSSIDEKAALLPRYTQRVAKNWLLLVAGGTRPSQFFDAPSTAVASAVSSPFARTFYFARMSGAVIELGPI
jgi:hypothetical protein